MNHRLVFLFSTLALLSLLLTGCGFRPLRPNDIPPQLRTLYLDTPNPYSQLSVQLRRLLTSLKVRITNTSQRAPITLQIVKTHSVYSMPPILYSGNATTYTFSLSATFQLKTKAGKIIYGPKTLTLSRPLVQNANQVYTPNAVRLLKRELTQTMVILIYNQITSGHAQKVLQKNSK